MRRVRAPAVLRCRPACSCACTHSRCAVSPSSRWYLLQRGRCQMVAVCHTATA